MYALADCNNFYVSCERVFNPKLINQPVIVLSNNNGCVVARSNEAKKFGITIGEPFFKIKSYCFKNKIKVYSSNYALYQDMSRRVMNTLESLCEHIEIYSIDEAFLTLDNKKNAIGLSHSIRHQVTQHTGIPLSIGIGPTKTLAKAASYIAKKISNTYVFSLEHPKMQNYWLSQMPIHEVWGIEKKISSQLEKLKINTALDFKLLNLATIRSQFGFPLEKIHRELNNFCCHERDNLPNKKGITSSRLFNSLQTSKQILLESVNDQAARSSQNTDAKQGSIPTNTNLSDNKQSHNSNSSTASLPQTTNNSSTIIRHRQNQLHQIYKEGKRYNKLDVMLLDFIPAQFNQHSIFTTKKIAIEQLHQANQLTGLLDKLNKIIGKKALFIATQGVKQSWQTRGRYRSQHYTTRWQELPLVK